jgi:hypothetical protein
MRFLFKIVFWFSLVLLIIPLGESSTSKQQQLASGAIPPEPVGALDTFLAAREAITDVGAICERKPTVCEVGREAMNTVGIRAREVARIAFQMLDQNFGSADGQVVTGSVPKEVVPPSPKPTAKPALGNAEAIAHKVPRAKPGVAEQ